MPNENANTDPQETLAGGEGAPAEDNGSQNEPQENEGTTPNDETSGSLIESGGVEDDNGKEPDPETDWREEFSGGDDKLKKVISRYRSPRDVAKALADAKNYIRSNKSGVNVPGDDASDEELSEYRKAMGVPESAEDYEVSWAEGAEPSEQDREILNSFADQMHKKNATPAQLQAAVDWYNDQIKAQQQAAREVQYQTQVETQSELKAEWGGEYKSNLNAIKQFAVSQFGGDEEVAMDLFRTPLADGSLLGDNMAFIKMLATPAVDYVGPNAIFSGDTVKTSQNLEQRKDELLDLRINDPTKYKSEAVQRELAGIYEKLEKLEERR